MGKKGGYLHICEYCGKEFRSPGQHARFCSKECRHNFMYTEKTCPGCGKTFVGHFNAKYCSEKCRKLHDTSILREENYQKNNETLTGEEGVDYVVCQLCHNKFRQLQNVHFKVKHNCTTTEYLSLYPNAELTCKNYIQTHLAGDNNPRSSSNCTHKELQETSPFSKEYYKKRGLPIENYYDFIRRVANNRDYTTRLSFYLKKGMTEEDAKEALANRQRGLGGGAFSMFSINLIKEVLGKKINSSKYRWGHTEFNILYENENGENKQARYDLTNVQTKRIIEINGDFWHGNPEKYSEDDINSVMYKTYKEIHEHDNLKKNVALQNGYEVLTIWESDYYKNKDTIIQQCKEFIL